MSTRSVRSRKRLVKAIGIPIATIALLGSMALGTTFVPAGEDPVAQAAQSEKGAGAEAEMKDLEGTLLPKMEKEAVPLADIVTAASADPDAAGKELSQQTSPEGPFSYVTTFEGTLQKNDAGQLVLSGDRAPAGVEVVVSGTPDGASTALRDAALDVEYGDYQNQGDFQQVALDINKTVGDAAYSGVTPDDLVGKNVSVLGAFTWSSPTGGKVERIVVFPARLEVK